ncbi:cytochrome P450 [Paenibacillus sp. MWE-103]|uniref:Cytochrome P450 n=1 Tax=Paenibacillus artemisiicola TaxID=1172618 RepID=A0ABS3W9B9_9BACL|nr:cytochrome P450 [Paenibacillus artemisiicola]MBO7744867.1 cytochrome P450 [Paenibacillus artemisiicola]
MLLMPELDTTPKRLLPFGILSRLREETPVRYDKVRNCWDVFGYDNVHRVLKDYALFSSVRGASAGTSMLYTDPPKHAQLRDLVNKAFTPREIQAFAPRIEAIAGDLLERARGGAMDIVHDFATPLPVIIIAEMLGAPQEDRERFKHWSDVLVESAADDSDEAFRAVLERRQLAIAELTDYFAALLEERAKQPREDLISLLLAAEIDGERLTPRELISFCILLLAAGNETTTNLITNGVRLLTERPELQRELRRQPEAVPDFVEETLRYYPPIVAVGRVAKEDTAIGDAAVKAGDQIIAWVGAANRDPAKFDDPESFVLGRKPNAHMSFGFGIHFCLGAPLARLEAKLALGALLARTGEIRALPDAELTPIPSSFVFGVKSHPVTLEAR